MSTTGWRTIERRLVPRAWLDHQHAANSKSFWTTLTNLVGDFKINLFYLVPLLHQVDFFFAAEPLVQ